MITNTSLQVRLQPDGVNFTLMEFLYCNIDNRRFRGAIGATSDGMSGGKLVKALLQDRHTFFEAVFHDCCYRDFVEESKDDGETWFKYSPTFEESNRWLKQNILDAHGNEVEAETVYLGVSTPIGQKNFNDDRGIK